jgi:ABC-type transport system involved in multi-copper enzyme maturation permease subunit
MPGSRVCQTVIFLMKSLLKTGTAAALIGTMVLLTLLSISTRLAVVQGGENSFHPVRMLIEDPTIGRIQQMGPSVLSTAGASEFRDEAAILFDETIAFSPRVSVVTLDGLLLIALPFVALLIGASLSPQRESPLHTLLSAPMSRFSLYFAHVMSAVGVLLVMLATSWLGGSLLLLVAVPEPWGLIRLLTLLIGFASLYAIIFASLGLTLGILFSKRATGLMAGLVVIMILVGLMPSLGETTTRSYADTHREAYREYVFGGAVPTDIAWFTLRAIQHTPANALKTILWITEAFSPIPRAGCMLCGGMQQPARGNSIRASMSALLIAALGSVAIGGIAFARKDMAAL